MNLLYLSLAPSMGFSDASGYGTHMREVSRALEAAGHRVVRYVAGSGGLVRGEDLGSGQTSVPRGGGGRATSVLAPARHLARDLRELWLDRRAEGELARLLREERIEAVYERSAFLQLAGIKMAASLRLPHVLEVNAPIEERRQHHGFPLYPVGVKRERRKLALADQVVCVTTPLRDYLVARGADPGRVTVIPNAARADAFALEPERRVELRCALGIGADQVAVGFVGRFGFWRGMDTLMQAIGRAASDQRLHFVLVGDGQRMPEVRRFIAERGLGQRVTLTGSLDPGQVPGHIAALDIGVLAGSPWYSSPIKLFEYGAAGLAVVAPRVQAVEEVLSGGKEGVLVPPEDAAALARAILELAASEEFRRTLAARFRARVLGAYTWDHVASRIEAVIAKSPRRSRSCTSS